MPDSRIPPRALVMLVALTLVWGANWPLFPLAVREVSVWTFRAVAMTGAGAVLLLIARLRGEALAIPRGQRLAVLAASLVYLCFWHIASTYAAVLIPSGQAAVLGFTMPLWLALLSWMVLGTALGVPMLLALLLGGTGVALLMVPGLQAYADAPLGFALGLASAAGWAVGTLILKRAGVQMPLMALTGWQLLLGAVPVIVVAFWRGEGPWFWPSWTSVAVITWIRNNAKVTSAAIAPVATRSVLMLVEVRSIEAAASSSCQSQPVIADAALAK